MWCTIDKPVFSNNNSSQKYADLYDDKMVVRYVGKGKSIREQREVGRKELRNWTYEY